MVNWSKSKPNRNYWMIIRQKQQLKQIEIRREKILSLPNKKNHIKHMSKLKKKKC